MASGDRPNTVPKLKKAGKLSQKEQSERFKEAARELEADESGKDFERAIGRILPRKAYGPATSNGSDA
ncbi:hypothetical protein NKJ06_07270 [Mesorhizobium sp. M0293]|uniref:hypothetical protein n=1 Tax=unclassified Mesorhizobium TaxID=325217 RepID=UPI003334C3FC